MASQIVYVPWHGKRLEFDLDTDIPGVQDVLAEAARIVRPITEWREVRAILEAAFVGRDLAVDVSYATTARQPYEVVTVRIRAA